MKIKHLLCIVCSSILAHPAFAGCDKPYALVGSLSAGPIWNKNGGDTQNIYLTPDIEKKYVADNKTNAMGAGEIFLGAQRDWCNKLQTQLGFAFAATSSADLSGDIWDDADPQFDNYTYKYKLKQTQIAIKGKLLADRGYWLIPWISGSVGLGFNKAYGFSNTPTIDEAVPSNDFTSNTTTAFTYTLGAGVQKNLDENWQVGIGYQFSDWGKSQLGKASGQTENQGPELNHFYTNGFLLNVTYVQ